jgi:hypothetical protein
LGQVGSHCLKFLKDGLIWNWIENVYNII